jgi:hypothetical protein
MAAGVVAFLVGLSALFARSQNPGVTAQLGQSPAETAAPRAALASPAPPPVASPPAPPQGAADSIRGRMVFDSAGCTRCHSVAGVGSPRYPLDGVGARRSEAELRAWTQGADALADSLPPSALRSKQAYREMKPADLDALIAFLRSLRR